MEEITLTEIPDFTPPEPLSPETPPPDAQDPPETADPWAERQQIHPAMLERAETKERKRWEEEACDARLREASLRAWEKERLGDAETRESRLAPFDTRDPYEYSVDTRVPRVAAPKEKVARRYEPQPDVLDDAETELTAVIAECRYFMREMAFESARTTPIANDRIRFIESARTLAETSAALGKSIAIVRNPSLAEPEDKKKRARR
ncbi:MAG: hypothetical protein WDM89_09605 [Rhizomicrobium sp.]